MSTLKALNKYQRKLFTLLLIIISLGSLSFLVAFIAFFLYLFNDYSTIFITLFSVTISVFILCFILYIVFNNLFNRLFINKVINEVLNELYDNYLFTFKKEIAKEIIERSEIYGDELISVRAKNFIALKLDEISLQTYEINVNETDYHHRRLNGRFIHFIFPNTYSHDVIIFPRKKEDYIAFNKGGYELINAQEFEQFCLYVTQDGLIDNRIKTLSQFLLNKYHDEIFFISVKGKELFIQIEKINHYNLSVYHPFYKKDYLKLKEDLKIYQEIKEIME